MDLCPMCDGCGSRDDTRGNGYQCGYCRGTGRVCLDPVDDDATALREQGEGAER